MLQMSNLGTYIFEQRRYLLGKQRTRKTHLNAFNSNTVLLNVLSSLVQSLRCYVTGVIAPFEIVAFFSIMGSKVMVHTGAIAFTATADCIQ